MSTYSGENLVNNDKMQIEKITLGPFETNAYVIVCQETKQSVLVDAPAEAETLLEKLKGTTPQYLLLTHSHPDHTGALAKLKETLHVPLGAHPEEAKNLSITPELMLTEGTVITVGKLQLEVLHTPGHTGGSICFKMGDFLFGGDTLFPGGPGKTFSPKGFQQIIESITQKIFTLPEETMVLPGHGDSTMVKKAQEEYLVFSSKKQREDLYGDVLWLS